MSVPQEDPAESAIARLNEVINKAQENITTQTQKVREAPDPLGPQRDWIGKVIIGVFACALLLGFFTLVLEGFRGQGQPDGEIWEKVANQATDLIKSAVLPVVTLVLGYYFGQASRT